MEITANGLRPLRGFMGSRLGEAMLEELIHEAETGLVEVKRSLVQ